MRHIIAIFGLLLLAGCASPLQQLKEINPQATDFPTSLASEYLAYADSESEQGRKIIAEHFAQKGMHALKGEPALPEEPDASLHPKDQQELALARLHLMKLLNDDMKSVAPQKLARAQLLFDCWQHEVARRINQEKAPCDDEFKSSLSELQDIEDSFLYGKEMNYAVTFGDDTVILDEKAKDVIGSVAEKAARASRYTVELRVDIGKEPGARALAENRVTAVRKALIDAGIAEGHIRVKKQGGSKAVVLTGNDLHVPHVQEVKITIKTGKPAKGHGHGS